MLRYEKGCVSVRSVLFREIWWATTAEQTAYVTDSLLLRLYSQSNDASEVTESIKSGDAVEVLESQGEFTQVRIYDGTTVWVKSAFLAEAPQGPQNYFITL